MDREILFRGKRLDNGEWVEGFYCKMDETTYAFEEDYKKCPVPTHHYIIVESMTDWGLPNRLLCVEINSETVCQYTGLTDKNGKKIFEGDILSARLDDSHPDDITYVQVVWSGFSWCIRESTDKDVMEEEDGLLWEVCGNIFDNPSLLEGGES